MDILRDEITRLVAAVETHVRARVSAEMRERVNNVLSLDTKRVAASKARRGVRHCGVCESVEHDARNCNKKKKAA